VTQCRCDPEVVTVHLFTLATMVFVLQLTVNTITVKISVGFFGFQVIQRNSTYIQEERTLKQAELTH